MPAPHAHVRFRRAIERRALWLAKDAARGLPNQPLEDALEAGWSGQVGRDRATPFSTTMKSPASRLSTDMTPEESPDAEVNL